MVGALSVSADFVVKCRKASLRHRACTAKCYLWNRRFCSTRFSSGTKRRECKNTIYFTVSTGTFARCTTALDTLPRTSSLKPLNPLLPITIRSTLFESAALRISSATALPLAVMVSTASPNSCWAINENFDVKICAKSNAALTVSCIGKLPIPPPAAGGDMT